DLKKLRKSLSCHQVICFHDPCEAAVNEPYVWRLAELLRNRGNSVDWKHWAELPHWTAKEGACLMYSVDPQVFENAKPTNPAFMNIPLVDLNECITKLTQHAERSLKEAAPLEWLQWARGRGLGDEIHPRLSALVAACPKKPMATTVRKTRTRTDRLKSAILAALRNTDSSFTADDLFNWMGLNDATGTIVDHTPDKLVWEDSRGNCHDIDRPTFANRVSRLRNQRTT
ncbi:hypothetical protein, partial [Methylomagnum sp.]